MITPTGWNTWDVRSLNAAVHLPSALRVRFSLYDTRTGQSRNEFDWRTGMQRLGPHATDGSYCQIDLMWNQAIVGIEYASQGDRLVCRVTPQGMAPHDHLLLLVELDGAWGHPVQAQLQSGELAATVDGENWIARSTCISQVLDGRTVLAFTLDETVYVQVEPQANAGDLPPSDDLRGWIEHKRETYKSSGLRSEGWLDGAADGLTRGIAWNTIWEPIKGRICTPVSRDWCKGAMFGSYVLFDWDTFFCAVMAALEDPALAVANVHAILQEVSSRGFVPNFGCEFGPSEDRSQPPVGAYAVLKLSRGASLSGQDSARALLKATFPALTRWHDWWLPHRDGNVDGLLEWGSDPLPGGKDWQWGNMQAAMYESGLDNSPMYDDTLSNAQTHTMELADVGLNALYAMDAWALGEIAAELGLIEQAQQFVDEYTHMGKLINAEMWDETAGIYKNRHWDGRLSPHLSPTNFYPLIAGIAPQERAQRMVREHLLNDKEFWGRYVIPSTARDDPGYGGNDYWRGRIWGPMNFLVGEGLRRYAFDAEAHEFARRGLSLFLGEWLAESHVHENFNTDTGDGDDMPNSDPVYTWGALLAYIAIEELVDAEPWGGWRFGNLNGETASVKGVRVDEGILDVAMRPRELSVMLNGKLLVTANQPVVVRQFRRESNQLNYRLTGDTNVREATLLVGQLPPHTPVRVDYQGQSVQLATDDYGQVSISTPCDVDISIHW